MAIIQALSKGLVKKGDKWVCLSGIPQTKVLDNLLILEFGKEFEARLFRRSSCDFRDREAGSFRDPVLNLALKSL